ncbi:uncharacterized protein LOC122848589 [Aphidius gifuensis]|uniref:uncharacterized protein LOC122848589 n=1 Tax=Aphidius gifuensis TaxID=684658 RepID=UPI001CDCC090|nr:uncharacterized protein LOC122848589 [Aphidius gifuensis]
MYIDASDCYNKKSINNINNNKELELLKSSSGISCLNNIVGGYKTTNKKKIITDNPYKISTTVKASELWCCCCNCTSTKSTKAPGFLACLGVCVLVFGYTLLGAFSFMALEGGFKTDLTTEIRFTGTNGASSSTSSKVGGKTNSQQTVDSSSLFAGHSNEDDISVRDLRAYTVERLWSITEDLNVLYKENWTRLAEREIFEFQERMAKSLYRSSLSIYGNTVQRSSRGHDRRTGFIGDRKWTFGSSLLYSLTLITTIGYGCVAPRTIWGRVITIVYALAGIPLMLVYLSTVGDVFARTFRKLYGKLCHCNNNNNNKNNKNEKFIVTQPPMPGLIDKTYHRYDNHIEAKLSPGNFYSSKDSSCDELGLRATGGTILLDRDHLDGNIYIHTNSASSANILQDTEKRHLHSCTQMSMMSSPVSYGTDTICVVRIPISLCLLIILLYVCGGAYVFHRLEGWSLLESTYFCFTSLGTIGFGELVPLGRKAPTKLLEELSLCACSLYIIIGMGLIAMCFNLMQEEVVRVAGVFGKNCTTNGIPINSFGENGYKGKLCEDIGMIGNNLPDNCRHINDHDDDAIAMSVVSTS